MVDEPTRLRGILGKVRELVDELEQGVLPRRRFAAEARALLDRGLDEVEDQPTGFALCAGDPRSPGDGTEPVRGHADSVQGGAS